MYQDITAAQDGVEWGRKISSVQLELERKRQRAPWGQIDPAWRLIAKATSTIEDQLGGYTRAADRSSDSVFPGWAHIQFLS